MIIQPLFKPAWVSTNESALRGTSDKVKKLPTFMLFIIMHVA